MKNELLVLGEQQSRVWARANLCRCACLQWGRCWGCY